ncbi:hypothetical protein EVAR_24624_1 [Eumeta japonica]|uniref:Uncharacterized protein n=1 Tax=Eumeta variegata TaxID=151549 RepID=A0A4C1V1Q1_EUMVA|nr:hypothetical protein EVAR_24624_1 [Eumeta japonica]
MRLGKIACSIAKKKALKTDRCGKRTRSRSLGYNMENSLHQVCFRNNIEIARLNIGERLANVRKESGWPPPLMDTRNSTRVTNALPAPWLRIRYLMEERVGHRRSYSLGETQ